MPRRPTVTEQAYVSDPPGSYEARAGAVLAAARAYLANRGQRVAQLVGTFDGYAIVEVYPRGDWNGGPLSPGGNGGGQTFLKLTYAGDDSSQVTITGDEPVQVAAQVIAAGMAPQPDADADFGESAPGGRPRRPMDPTEQAYRQMNESIDSLFMGGGDPRSDRSGGAERRSAPPAGDWRPPTLDLPDEARDADEEPGPEDEGRPINLTGDRKQNPVTGIGAFKPAAQTAFTNTGADARYQGASRTPLDLQEALTLALTGRPLAEVGRFLGKARYADVLKAFQADQA